ncbi:competence protein ComEA [Knoellia remsis]|uniref:Competence protein ComEA n=1 Tax=Knoellia remsis TaxID=407159 RepID=A0A2T0TZ23_9MICO|nr:ComEA family DNA-binding protein [Knoellia remsis]PRY50922.1 competence protein ComEA [Knoellia remsis]
MPSAPDPETDSPRARLRERAGHEPAGRARHRPIEVPRGPVFELPASLREARWVPSGGAALAVVAVVVVVALVFGARVWLASGSGEAVATGEVGPSGVTRGTSTLSRASPDASPSPAGPDGPGGTASPGGSPAAGGRNPLVVHVVGQVAKPGVYSMPPGARVTDAVRAAGGATRGADLAAVNLARAVVDGEQIVVPKPGEVVAGGAAGAGGTAGAGGGGAPGASGGGSGSGGTVSLNTADLAALESLPGVGPVLAQRILDWRTENGRFTTVEELGEVSGIGEKLLAQITPKVTL